MPGLVNPPGYGGFRWGAVEWSRFNYLTNAPFTVGSATDWRPTINTSVARTINIAPGIGQAYGIFDETTATESVAFAANTSGTDRWDALVARFNWTTKTRTFEVIQGTTVSPAINTTQTLDINKINRIPGARYDGLIAYLKIPTGRSIFQPQDLYSDMRVWGGATGPMVSNAISAARTLIHVPTGGQVTINGLDTYVRQPNNSLTSIRPRLLAVGTGLQSVPFNADVSIALSNQVIAQGVSYNPANGRCTFTEAGDYWCAGTVMYVASPNWRGKRNVSLGRNGTPLLYATASVFMNDADNAYVNVAALLHFEAGEYLSLMTAHEAEVPATGANVATTINRSMCQLSAMYAGG